MGNPKYFPREGVDRKPRSSHSSILLSIATLGEKYTWDLSWLTFWTNKLQRESNTSFTAMQFLQLAFANSTWSSAKKRWEKAKPPWVTLTRFQRLLFYFSIIRAPKTSMHRINREGERGSPCLIPLEGRKESNATPLQRTEIEEVDTQLIIRDIN